MPKCPKCGAEITSLYSTAMAVVASYFNEDGSFEEWDIATFDDDTFDFRCYACGAILFYKEEEAKKFLKS